MSRVGTEADPLRIAIIGSGPAAFFAAEHLLKQPELGVEVDMFDRVPVPFGLVRYGVAPDHHKIKGCTRVFDRTAVRPSFRFYGNVEFGKHVTLDDMRCHYHQILYATGAQTDRRMNIPGEDLDRSHPATEFVAWYNGHPDYSDLGFDLSVERAAVVGVGNVAIDVARILCRSPEELAATDMADYAIDALSKSGIKEVYLLGRRGPAQAKFTNPEIKEVGELAIADVTVPAAEAQLDELSRKHVGAADDRSLENKVRMLQEYSQREPAGKNRRLHIRFLISPVELRADSNGRVSGARLVRNVLYESDDGSLRPKATEEYEDLDFGLIFRSVGYRGVPLPGVPFYDRWGVIPNDSGRVTDEQGGRPVVGEYVAGWIKRGPSGVIGTNKPDAVETVEAMLSDLADGMHLHPDRPGVDDVAALVSERQPRFFSYADWQRLDELEVAAGQSLGRPRVKFTSTEAMLTALGRA